MDKRILTWDKAGARWVKVYRGRKWYGVRGVKKSDKQAYQKAVSEFQAWKQIADTDVDAHKPHAEQYSKAIALRQAMVNWLLLERDNQEQFNTFMTIEQDGKDPEVISIKSVGGATYNEEYDRLVKEIDRLKLDFARLTPPELDKTGTLTTDPLALRSIAERDFWLENIDALRSHNRWIGTTEHAKTVGANLDDFLAEKQREAESGQIAYGWFAVIRYHLEYVRKLFGEVAVENVNANLLTAYHGHLLDTIKAGTITTTYAKGLLATMKSFVRWLYMSEVIDIPPRNLAKLKITVDDPTITTLTIEEIKALLQEATDRTRLYVLLMANCGMTGKDISDLTPDQIDWQDGRVIRKRSKTKREKNVPVVNYKLWRATFDLLKRYGKQNGERIFVNKNGQPLRRWEEKENGKPRNVDNVRDAWRKLAKKTGIRKSLKLLRSTSSSTLAKHETYGQFAFLFLGHSPKTTAERHYIQVPQALFDNAITWLGKEYGIT